ncbi:ATP-dependent phosphoenolpyruvate carboxykinase [Candidatus Nitrososphaera evergladensis SR1]|uniref:Phosphoenolpyruvate carboxykinase (ATP) n=2 Tax=Nitrososphaera TaxID=497726 RepID=A0A075MPA0_9ARCH|nr:phosphoenolpyruvate carboxykinase (ATP) [Candidatus Nitrososphaera evergladensis]AIF83371.1 ATP-dependent phosphoenolpyruvate carboxykinase [Candidatus Nitrososphaera evergladensis SR1]
MMIELATLDIKLVKAHMNLPVPALVEMILQSKEGVLSSTGALSVRTGKFTGRSPDDKFLVDDDVTHGTVDWGKVNRPISEENFDKIYRRMKKHIEDKELFVFDGYVGADPENRLPIRVINNRAWHNLFARQIFIRPDNSGELDGFKPEFTLISADDFAANPASEGTRTETFIIVNFKRKIVLIGSTSYAGEIKKAMFSIMNFLLPRKGIFPMHCSANVGKGGDVALFFGLSGTGKTTLSADPERRLVGDDEHGWSDNGVFNFEGGCYAKCINLKKEHEPQIWNAIKFGSLMENVVITDGAREPDFADGSLTENTRVVYPLDFIDGAIIPSVAGHPKVIIFLTADAFGVMPPIAKLTKEGAMYHFMSGYTSKLAGTERGITEPKETFSQCFGGPFMPLHAQQYAKLLGKKMDEHGTRVYLINTGWTGGPYGIGKRMNLSYTRAMVTAALSGDIEKSPVKHHDIFNLDMPTSCPGVPPEVLDPRNTWHDKDKYDAAAKRLAALFAKNFEKFGSVSKEIASAGPRP